MARSRQDRLRAAEEARPAAVTGGSRRLDVRGMRVDELVREVERFLDGLYTEGAADALFLHGHGTGALKEALRAHLRASPYVASFRAGETHEGGDAVTLVAMKR